MFNQRLKQRVEDLEEMLRSIRAFLSTQKRNITLVDACGHQQYIELWGNLTLEHVHDGKLYIIDQENPWPITYREVVEKKTKR